MPYPVRTVSFCFGLHARPMRGAKPHCRWVINELLAPAVAMVGLFPAISSPEPVIVSVPAL